MGALSATSFAKVAGNYLIKFNFSSTLELDNLSLISIYTPEKLYCNKILYYLMRCKGNEKIYLKPNLQNFMSPELNLCFRAIYTAFMETAALSETALSDFVLLW
jgi:hypothetical protein